MPTKTVEWRHGALILFALLSPFALASDFSGEMVSRKTSDLEAQETKTLTIDTFLAQEFKDKPTSHFDAQSGIFTVEGTVQIKTELFKVSELPKLKALVELGVWVDATGRRYDLRNARMTFRDGKGGIADQIDFFMSDQFSQAFNEPAQVQYPRSPYRTGMSPERFLERVVSRLNQDDVHIDEATGAVHVNDVALPLHELDEGFCLEVLGIVTSGKVWTSASGSRYDFTDTHVHFPISQIGTPEQRRADDDQRHLVQAKLSEFSKNANPTQRRNASLAAMIKSTMSDSTKNPLLARLGVVAMKPFSRCNALLVERAAKKTEPQK